MKHTIEDLANKEWEWGVFGPFCKQMFDSYGLPIPKDVNVNPRMDVTRFTGSYVELPPATFTAVSSFTSEVNLWTLPNIWSYIPLGNMRNGAAFECRGGGIYSVAATAPTSANIFARVGVSATPSSNVLMGQTATFVWANAASSQGWYFQYTFVVRTMGLATAGASGTGNGFIVFGSTASVVAALALTGAAVTTIDNTIANGFMLSVSASTAAASTSLTTQWIMLRQLN